MMDDQKESHMKMLAIVTLGLSFAHAFSQVETSRNPDAALVAFDVDAISFASDTSKLSRLDIYAAIPYEQLSFVKGEDGFRASYEITVDVLDSAKALVSERLWTRETKTPTFDQSVSTGSYSVDQVSLMLHPGYYQISVFCRDLESKVTRRVNKEVRVSDYSEPGLHLSDIMLVGKLASKGDKRSITPSISPNVGSIAGPFHLFFEAYNPSKVDSVKFVTSVFDTKKNEVMKFDTSYSLISGRDQVLIRVDQAALPIGDYKIVVAAFPLHAGTDEPPIATTNRLFIVRWSGMPRSIKDIDVSIEQLVYIAKDKELDHIKEAKIPEEKQKRFFEFWKKRDPNPNTARNERMERYYARVDYANKHFKHYTEGWRTDMGMVFIRFGQPSNVDRHPFDSDSKPYEVWSYYRLNYSFVFLDQTGFGDYRLVEPLGEVWQRATTLDDDGL
jgi:GWxTD domain-containing protein